MHNPEVPETFEGWSVLHQMFRIRWESWKALPQAKRAELAEEAAGVLGAMAAREEGTTGLVNLLGHKGDLMLTHFRPSFDDLSAAELEIARTGFHDHLIPTTSFVSVVELGGFAALARRLAGLAAMHEFLLAGFRAFKDIGGASEFLARIDGRERLILDRLFAGETRGWTTV